MPVFQAAPTTAALGSCACGQPVEMQYQRHATQAEYDTLPDGLKPIDGIALVAVRVCGDCHPAPICQHPDDAPVPCPDCHAQPGAPCTGRNGGPRAVDHPARLAAQPKPETCRHAHREDCTDPRECQCTGDEPAPVRIPRAFVAPTAHEQAAALGFPPAFLPVAARLLADNHIDPRRVRGGLRTGLTQDNRPAILFDYADGDDGHGHEVVETRVVPVEG